jgi:threonine aldolase
VPTRALAVEQTHNRAGGAVIPLGTLQALRAVADEARVALHCDGARIWHAHIADGVPLATYGALFDTMSVCLSKGLGAPVGSILCGPAGFIEEGLRVRKRLGGGMRQAGVLAAAGLVALRENVERLAEDHDNARRLAEGIVAIRGLSADPARVQTNIVVFSVAGGRLTAHDIVGRWNEAGVLALAIDDARVRAVTHYDVNRTGIDRALESLRVLMNEGTGGAS